jgi:hypothetical protein
MASVGWGAMWYFRTVEFGGGSYRFEAHGRDSLIVQEVERGVPRRIRARTLRSTRCSVCLLTEGVAGAANGRRLDEHKRESRSEAVSVGGRQCSLRLSPTSTSASFRTILSEFHRRVEGYPCLAPMPTLLSPPPHGFESLCALPCASGLLRCSEHATITCPQAIKRGGGTIGALFEVAFQPRCNNV